jgi:hypothetical protein
MVCTNLSAERYDFIVAGDNFLILDPHTMKALHAVIGKGHWKTFRESASKQANVLRAEEYFVQVDFAMAEFTIPKYPLYKFGSASGPRVFFASVRSCNWKRLVFEYLSREQPVQI